MPELNAKKTVLAKLFDSEKEFRAPIFQRPYVWGAKQLDRLWSDIEAVQSSEDSSRFLGAIVLLDRSTPSASGGPANFRSSTASSESQACICSLQQSPSIGISWATRMARRICCAGT